MNTLESARAVADAVLFEGYVLYPYRASAQKNRMRWQWGVLMPPDVVEADSSERSWSQTECLLEGKDPVVVLRVRCLHVQQRRVEAADSGGFIESSALDVGDTRYVPWDEAVEENMEVELAVSDLLDTPAEIPFEFAAGDDVESIHLPDGSVAGRLVRRRWPLSGALIVDAVQPVGPYGVIKLRARVENRTTGADPADIRDIVVRHALVAAHLVMGIRGGSFLSLLEPPRWATGYAEECENVGTFPVLTGVPGQEDAMLSSPIILYDHPQVAPESTVEFFDSTEMDEMLSLRAMTLTDAEQREARGTDPRAAALLDQVNNMPQEMLDRLHGAVRYLEGVTGAASVPGVAADPTLPKQSEDPAPWWDPGADATVSPETDSILIEGVAVSKGSRLLLRPGARRSDVQDMFLAGRLATVAAVFVDVDGAHHLAVTVDDDPAADLQQAHGRYLYFAPDEVEPVRAGS